MDAQDRTDRKQFLADMGIIAFWNKDPEMNNTAFDNSPSLSKKKCNLPVKESAGAVIKTEKKYKRRKIAEVE
ncbi:MAG TPA: hypothetical protein GXX36_13540 [Clostridiaceae bacterium]|nr:hypothetical protein [Clostridiaceae bacterium]